MENKGKGELLSVTVLKQHNLSEKELVERVKQELQEECNIKEASFLKTYNIPKAFQQLEHNYHLILFQ